MTGVEYFKPGTGDIFGDVAAVSLVSGMDSPPTETDDPAAYIKGQNLFLFGAIPQNILWALGVFKCAGSSESGNIRTVRNR